MKIAAALIFTITTWASAFVAIRAGLDGFHPGSLALFRFLVASFTVAILYAKEPIKMPLNRQDIIPLLAIGFFGYAVYNVALNYGELTVTAGIASFIMSLSPVLVIILASIFLGERLSLAQWFGVLVSLLGIFVITLGRGGFGDIDIGVTLIILAAFSAAIYVVLQKPILKRLSPLHVTTAGIWIGTLFLLVYLPQLALDIRSASPASLIAGVYLGIFPAALGFLAWSYVLSHYDASKAIMYLYAMPLIATLLSWILLGEVPTLLSFIGGLIALSGAVIVNLKRS